MQMLCPIHSADMVEVSISNYSILECSVCGGIWLPSSTLEKVSNYNDLIFPDIKTEAISKSYKFSPTIKCPTDKTRTLCFEYRGVEIDICRNCAGIWLDSGEIEKILDISRPSWKSDLIEAGVQSAINIPDLIFNSGEYAVDAGKMLIDFIAEALSTL